MGYTGDKKREYQRQWVAKRRNEYFQGKSCVDCGATENLELDHVDPCQKVSHRIWSWSRVRIENELAKCVVRCRIHHYKKTTENGEHPRGENHPHSKLNDDNVREIRKLFFEGVSKRELGRRFNVNEIQIRKIISGKTWKHVK